MKFPIALAIMLTLFSPSTAPEENDGHVLKKLWASYDKAAKADRPADQAEILLTIKEEAAGKRLAWDYYDAGRKYVDVKSSMDWKLREELNSEFIRDIEAFGEPVAIVFHYRNNYSFARGRKQNLADYVEENRRKLENSSNRAFYYNDRRLNSLDFAETLKASAANDYEYALWCCLLDGSVSEDTMRNYFGNSYPLGPLVDYQSLVHGERKDIQGLEEFAERYSGKAVSLFARQKLLEYEFNRLGEEGAGSEEYLRLRDKVLELKRARDAFSAKEKAVASDCKYPEMLLEMLETKGIQLSAMDDTLSIALRNLSSANVKVTGAGNRILLEKGITNGIGSFYAPDTFKVALSLPDGDYVVKCTSGKTENSINYNKHTLSIAGRRNSEGYGVYVADYISGEPLKNCRIILLNNTGKVIAALPSVELDGHTEIPESFLAKIPARNYGYALRAEYEDGQGRTRLSNRLSIDRKPETAVSDISREDIRRAMLLTDRSAFNIGETVHFKAVLYSGTESLTLAPEGCRVTASLLDPEGKKLSSTELVTNGFGSVAGDFVLQRSRVGGRYRISIEQDGRTLATRSVLADDYVFPTFNLVWDEARQLFLPGDTIIASGNIKAYSGHGLSSADIRYAVFTNSDEKVAEGPVNADSDGNFTVSFKSSPDIDFAYYRITVTATDATGETLEFSTGANISSNIPVYVDFRNDVPGRFHVEGSHYGRNRIVSEDNAEVRIDCYGKGDTQYKGVDLEYDLISEGDTVQHGITAPGGKLLLNLPRNGLYRLEVSASATSESGREFRNREKETYHIVKASDDDTALDCDVQGFFKETEGDGLSIQIGATRGPVWAVAELYSDGNRLLDRQMIYMEGQRGKEGSLRTVSFVRKESYPASLNLKVCYFKDKSFNDYSRTFRDTGEKAALPLGFSRFLDTTLPGKNYAFIIRTAAGVECAASIFDAASETFARNIWDTARPYSRPADEVYYSGVCGDNGGAAMMPLYGARYMKSAMVADSAAPMVLAEMAVVEEAAEVQTANATAGEGAAAIRQDFAATVAWEPFLRSDENGEISFRFRTSDKLSTYHVQIFAHDREFNNTVLRKSMVVTLPVKVAIVQPQYLFESDRYTARTSVSNNLDTDVDGSISIQFLNGSRPDSGKLREGQERICVPARGSAEFSLGMEIPAGLDTLGILVSFTPDGDGQASDAVFVAVPVSRAEQHITEAHSSIFRPGDDRERLLDELRMSFMNADAPAGTVREISILQMLREAIPEKLSTDNEDVMSLADVLYADYLLSCIDGKGGITDTERTRYINGVMKCHNDDGGFGWFAGMNSSPVITAALLERFHRMGASCPENIAQVLPEAARFLDRSFFGDASRPAWCGGVSLGQYLHVRSMFPETEADTGYAPEKRLTELRKEIREYLIPSGKRGLNGQIIDKARRINTLKALAGSEDGIRLIQTMGVGDITGEKLETSLRKDLESIVQYAQPHRSGCTYFPNAVMPWRGLLESELYAHAMLCELLESCGHKDIAEGIRLWIMVQKETQEWGSDPAYLEALNVVLKGSEETLGTKVLTVESAITLPFREIRSAGNGFTVEREFYRDGKLLQDGDTLHVGDRLTARYSISSDENRSFVKLTVPRNAALRPVEQRSGHYGWWARPLSVSGWVTFSPQGYRSVRADRTEYWFDSYPEFKSAITEDFFVTQEGTFQSAVPEIESLYAPHYRANDAGHSAMEVTGQVSGPVR